MLSQLITDQSPDVGHTTTASELTDVEYRLITVPKFTPQSFKSKLGSVVSFLTNVSANNHRQPELGASLLIR